MKKTYLCSICIWSVVISFFSFPVLAADESASTGKHYMATANNKDVEEVGNRILSKGGTAADAAVAMLAAMTVSEPEWAGIGGGAFMVYYDKSRDKNHRLSVYSGRETAPGAAWPHEFHDKNGNVISRDELLGPIGVAVPGALKMLDELYNNHQSTLGWSELFKPAIQLAKRGYEVDKPLHDILEREQDRLTQIPATLELYYKRDTEGKWVPKSYVKNPDLAKTLRIIANKGIQPFYKGKVAQAVVVALEQEAERRKALDPSAKGSILTLDDMRHYYRAKQNSQLVCQNYTPYYGRPGYNVCGIGAPASGTIMVGQVLGILSSYSAALIGNGEESPESWRIINEAMRLAHTDRLAYIGDPKFVQVPDWKDMLSSTYLDARMHMIPSTGPYYGAVLPGVFPLPMNQQNSLQYSQSTPLQPEYRRQEDTLHRGHTTHVSAVDRYGNAMAMTATLSTGMGSGIVVDGFVLNSELINFNIPSRQDMAYYPRVNDIVPNKMPRSAMSPTVVLNQSDDSLKMLVGSPGGGKIPGYVLKTLLGVLLWNQPIQKAIEFPNIQPDSESTIDPATQKPTLLVESGKYGTLMNSAEKIAEFEKIGYKVKTTELKSGLNGISISGGDLSAGHDPRRGWDH